MAVPLFDLSRQLGSLHTSITDALDGVLEHGRFIMGPQVQTLEEAVAAYLALPRSVAVASGTDALLLPLKALDPQPGDEVVVPAFTFFATAGAAWNAGFKPVFCDVDAETFNVTATSVEMAWSGRTRAIVPVHLFGQMAPMAELMALAEARGATVVEDAAQAFGAMQSVGGELRQAGSLGHLSSFSFFPTKNLGGLGDGGMVSGIDADLLETVALLRVHGGRKMYHHEMVGTNSRLDTLQAAVLLAKLPHVSGWVDARRKNAAAYRELLGGVEEIVLPEEADGNRHSYNQFTVRAEQRDELKEFLAGRGIGSGVYYPVPLHLQPCFSTLGYKRGDFPVSEALCQEVLSLPIFPELRENELQEVASAIRTFYGAA